MKASHAGREIVYDLLLPRQIDASWIGQMVSNLLANAFAYGDPKEPIRVQSWLEDHQFSFRWSTPALRYPEEAMKRLLQPFFRVEIRSNQQGLGLGLHIASEIAKAHGEQIRVESSERQTCFTFTMPVAPTACGST